MVQPPPTRESPCLGCSFPLPHKTVSLWETEGLLRTDFMTIVILLSFIHNYEITRSSSEPPDILSIISAIAILLLKNSFLSLNAWETVDLMPIWFLCCRTLRASSVLRCELCLLMNVGSVAKLYPMLCDPMDCNMPGFPVLHYLLEFVQIHIHWVSDAI